jgi:hypothetical protein
MASESTRPEPGNAEQHWKGIDPEHQPTRDQVAGLPRLVIECYTRLGANATPKEVAEELRRCGVEVSEREVKEVWSEGRK